MIGLVHFMSQAILVTLRNKLTNAELRTMCTSTHADPSLAVLLNVYTVMWVFLRVLYCMLKHEQAILTIQWQRACVVGEVQPDDETNRRLQPIPDRGVPACSHGYLKPRWAVN
jgi:hypothetical protein